MQIQDSKQSGILLHRTKGNISYVEWHKKAKEEKEEEQKSGKIIYIHIVELIRDAVSRWRWRQW